MKSTFKFLLFPESKTIEMQDFSATSFFPKDDNLGIYVENARRERGRASEGVAGWGG